MERKVKIDIEYKQWDYWRIGFKESFAPSSLFYGFFITLLVANGVLVIFHPDYGDIPFLDVVGVCLAFTILINLFNLCYGAFLLKEKMPATKNSFIFSEDGIDISSKEAKAFIEWDSISRAIENAFDIKFEMPALSPIYLPKRALGNEDLIALRNLLNENIGERALLKDSSNKIGLK